MQVFLPYDSFEASAKVLDSKRLYKQILECKQLISILNYKQQGITHYPEGHKNHGKKIGYMNHKAVRMWQGYASALRLYQLYCIKEWLRRRFEADPYFDISDISVPVPHWIGDEDVHSSYRAALLKKDYENYGKWNWKEEPKIAYEWREA